LFITNANVALVIAAAAAASGQEDRLPGAGPSCFPGTRGTRGTRGTLSQCARLFTLQS